MQVKPDIAVSLAQAQEIVNRFAEARTVARVSRLDGGGIGAIFEIAFADDGPSFVLKAYPESLHWKMQKEVTVCGLLQGKLSVETPKILLADETRAILDLNYVVMTKLAGEIMPEHGSKLTLAEKRTIFAEMGAALRQIHRIPMEAFGYIGPHGVVIPCASNRAYMSRQFDKKLAEFSDRGGDFELATRLGAFAAERKDLLDACGEPVLCHYDFHGSNVLVGRDGPSVRLTGILDFEGAIAADPLMDLAKALYYARGEDEAAALAAGYGVIRRPNWKEAILLYRVYCLLELWVWFAQMKNDVPLPGLSQELGRLALSIP